MSAMSSPPPASEKSSFRRVFERWSRRVRRRLLLGRVLGGTAVGLLVGAGVATLAWRTGHGTLRPAAAAMGVIGAAAGLAMAKRRRWDDGTVALYLDAKLAAGEAITTAVELEAAKAEAPGKSAVLARAEEALARATRGEVRATAFRSWHLAAPVGAAAIGWLSIQPLPAAAAPPPPPAGSEVLRLADVKGLEKAIRLAELNARDDAQRARLKVLAEEARRLREKLKAGVEKKEALADLAKLREAIGAERLSLGEGEERRGMEAALGKLGENADLKRAEKALGDRDAGDLDEEMERLADRLEQGDRERAQKTLEEAAEAAKKNGAPGVGKALEEERRRLAERGKKNDELRELAKALGDGLGEEGREALRDLGNGGDPKAAQRLNDAMEKALRKMTAEERKRLAAALKKRLAKAGGDPMAPSKKRLRDLAEELETEEGQQKLLDDLERMAKEEDEGSEEGKRQKKLGEAQEGTGETEGEAGGVPCPLPVGGGAGNGKGKAGGDGPEGKAQAGHTDGPGGNSDHKGETAKVEGDQVKARATGKMNAGKAAPGLSVGRTAGKAGETANAQGTGALGEAAAGEIGGVERSEVPGEYREQVGRYFQPR